MYRCRLLLSISVVAMLLMPANAPAAAPTVVDNFELYALGLVNAVASPPWTEAFNRGAAAVTIGDDGSNQYLVNTVTPLVDQTDAVWRGVTPVPAADVATTLYLRFRAENATANSSFGLTDMAVPVGYLAGSFGEYANQMRVSVQAGLLAFDVRNGGAFTPVRQAVTPGLWYNVWAVINNSIDKYDVYMTQGGYADATELDIKYSVMGFRKVSANPLVTFMAMTQGGLNLPNALQLDLDNICLTPGKNLSVPEPATMALLGLGSLALLRRRKS